VPSVVNREEVIKWNVRTDGKGKEITSKWEDREKKVHDGREMLTAEGDSKNRQDTASLTLEKPRGRRRGEIFEEKQQQGEGKMNLYWGATFSI